MSGFRKALATVLLAGALLALPAASADAAITCDYNDGADTLAVNADGADDFAAVGAIAGGEIVAADLIAGNPVACTGAGGPPRVDNIANLSLTGGGGDSVWLIQDPAGLAPGNGTTGEIEVVVALGGGDDQLTAFTTTTASDAWVLGSLGLNWNGDTDVDAQFLSVEGIGLAPGGGNDAVTARGADGTGAAYSGPGLLTATGGDGNDVLEGGETGDNLTGDGDDDTLRGFGGADELAGDVGTNQLDGGAGQDLAGYLNAAAPVTVDLNVPGSQSTGLGIDTLTSIEGVGGSNQADVLIGDGGPNVLRGADGDDTLDGRGGSDELNGEAGVNTATYAQAPGGVTVDLSAGTAAGADGADTLSSIATLIGSPFSDTLIGDAQNNSITALGGNDTVSAQGGADSVDVRDGGPDAASCGTEADTATADRASVDAVNADCETVAFLPEPEPEPDPDPDPDPGPGPGGGDPPAPEDRELAFDLAGKAKQKVVKRKGIVVRASCPLEDCAVRFRGVVKPATEQITAAQSERLVLKLKRRRLRKVKRALEADRRPKLSLRAEASDAAGNTVSDALEVRARP
jgi:hypothetical protein